MALAGVILAYSGYLKFAVPAIEGPQLVRERQVQVSLDDLPSPQEDKSHLVPLLPAGAWELSPCKRLLTDSGTILFKKLEPLDDGSLQITPFTLITGLDKVPLAATRHADRPTPTVLRCESGANLKFDKSIREVLSGKSKMKAARLTGIVDIYRPPSKPGQNDAMHIETSNVQIDKKRIYTLEQVQFAFGSSWGSGRNMQIDLAHDEDSAALIDFSSINGIRRLELAFLEKLRIEPTPRKTNLSATSGKASPQQGLGNAERKLFSGAKSPLEVTCRGPFVFDFESRTASFRDQVLAEQIDEFRDNIRCDELDLIFEDKLTSDDASDIAKNAPIKPKSTPGHKTETDIRLQRFIARGSPAVVVSRSHSAKFSAEHLSFHLPSNLIEGRCRTSSKEMVTVVSPEYQMVAKQLTYRLPDDGSLGEIDINGPGRMLRVGNPEHGDFYSSWTSRMTTRKVNKQPGLHRVLVDGSAEIRIANQTVLNADQLELFVWQFQKIENAVNNKKPTWEYQPAKLVTVGNVTITSEKLDGQANHLTATWPDPRDRQQNAKLPRQSSLQFATISNYRVGYRGTVLLQDDQGNFLNVPTQARPLARIPRQSGVLRAEAVSSRPTKPNQSTNSIGQTGFVEHNITSQQAVVQDNNVKTVGFDQELKPEANQPKRKLRFRGETVDVRLIESDGKTEIRDLTVLGNVTIVSTPIAAANAPNNQQPLTISGHRLQLTPQMGDGNYRALISGKNGTMATVSAKEISLAGQNINLDQEENKIWVEGRGTMKMRSNSEDGKPAVQPMSQAMNSAERRSPPQNLDVTWKGGMIFDGTKIYFEDDVVMAVDRFNENGNRSNIQARSAGLSVELTKPLQFQNFQKDDELNDASVRELILVDKIAESDQLFSKTKQAFKTVEHPTQMAAEIDGRVVIEDRTYISDGTMSVKQILDVPQAIVNVESGALKSKGPGKISVHRLGKAMSDMTPDPLGRMASNGKSSNETGISFLQVNFDREMVADANRREMQIDGNIRTVYSPVNDWKTTFDPDNFQYRTPGTVFMTCEKLLLAQWAPRAAEKKTSEMIATGNAHIFSDTFEAIADRVSYSQATDVLVIVGSSRNDANLKFKQAPNDKDPTQLVASKITYRIKDQATRTYGVKSLNINRN